MEKPEPKPILSIKLVRNDENDHVAMYVDGEMIHCNDYGAVDALITALEERGTVSEDEEITGDEFEARYA